MPDLVRWLDGIGLGKYAQTFTAEDVDLDILVSLSDGDLKQLGVSLGDRKRLLRAVESLRTERRRTEADPAVAITAVGASFHAIGQSAEQRQLTVLFCDLVNSTNMSRRLGAEQYRLVLGAYQSACANEIKRYGGFVARFVGDGILAYFGYPTAHEDDAERAVRAALGIVGSMVELNASVGQAKEVELAARIGIASGLVLVGDIIGEGFRGGRGDRRRRQPRRPVAAVGRTQRDHGRACHADAGGRAVRIPRVGGARPQGLRGPNSDLAGRARAIDQPVRCESQPAHTHDRPPAADDGLAVSLDAGTVGQRADCAYLRQGGDSASPASPMRCARSWSARSTSRAPAHQPPSSCNAPPIIPTRPSTRSSPSWQRLAEFERADSGAAKLEKLEALLTESGSAC